MGKLIDKYFYELEMKFHTKVTMSVASEKKCTFYQVSIPFFKIFRLLVYKQLGLSELPDDYQLLFSFQTVRCCSPVQPCHTDKTEAILKHV